MMINYEQFGHVCDAPGALSNAPETHFDVYGHKLLLMRYIIQQRLPSSVDLSRSSSNQPPLLCLTLHQPRLLSSSSSFTTTTTLPPKSRSNPVKLIFFLCTFFLCSCHSTIGCQCISSSCCPFDMGFLLFGAGRTAYFDHGGILHYVIRKLLSDAKH
ncbi:hypothetical protein RHMOL_Rhmol10G0295900 [Rhododendron molle]|uniref:Uncharacterized protein n=1 Tax=Rhododendron molle TaxID=49168 RepID=A0ACC0M840_RHOML|nr:hypothetical protein RHMOL_Rhmol10G0295900 [Rhododendron molle]